MDKLDDLFRGFRSGVTAPSEDAVSAARELLLGEIGSIDSPRPSRTRRRRVFVAIAAAILVGGVLVTPAIGIGGRLLDLIGAHPRGPTFRPLSGRPAGADRLLEQARRGQVDLRRERRWERTAEADANARTAPSCLVLQRAEDRLRRRADAEDVYVVNADGSGQRRLARNGGAPAWSPDGQTIVFSSGYKIYVMNADGSEHRPLTKQSIDRHTLAWLGRSLAWSPDGQRIAFLAGAGATAVQYCFHVFVMNADSS